MQPIYANIWNDIDGALVYLPESMFPNNVEANMTQNHGFRISCVFVRLKSCYKINSTFGLILQYQCYIFYVNKNNLLPIIE